MRWPWSRERGHPAPAPVAPEPKQVWDREKMKHQFEARGFKVSMGPVNIMEMPSVWPGNVIDPYDTQPAFHARYEEVVHTNYINLAALRNNIRTFKLQVREVFTDPQRVARRYKHRYLTNRMREQRMRDSFLFYNVGRKGNLRLVK